MSFKFCIRISAFMLFSLLLVIIGVCLPIQNSIKTLYFVFYVLFVCIKLLYMVIDQFNSKDEETHKEVSQFIKKEYRPTTQMMAEGDCNGICKDCEGRKDCWKK